VYSILVEDGQDAVVPSSSDFQFGDGALRQQAGRALEPCRIALVDRNFHIDFRANDKSVDIHATYDNHIRTYFESSMAIPSPQRTESRKEVADVFVMFRLAPDDTLEVCKKASEPSHATRTGFP
jgi:hypothetical protein